jgi:hypothetical protein
MHVTGVLTMNSEVVQTIAHNTTNTENKNLWILESLEDVRNKSLPIVIEHAKKEPKPTNKKRVESEDEDQ